MYIKCDFVSQARQVFDRLFQRNVVTWTSIIGGYVEHGDAREALCLFEKMLYDGVTPNVITFVCILKACRSLKNLHKGIEIHNEIERRGMLENHPVIGNILVNMYAKCELLHMALEVFNRLPSRNTITWTALITGYVEHGLGETALYCFEEMQSEGSFPDVFTFVSCLRACVLTGLADKAQDIHAEIERKGINKNIFLCSALIDAYAKVGLIDIAHELLDMTSITNLAAWNALISGYIEYGYDEVALECFEQMKGVSIVADHITFACILRACGQLENIDVGREIHAEVERQGLVKSHVSIGNALVDFYMKCHLLALAHQVFNMLSNRDLITWNNIIAGYLEHGCYLEAIQCIGEMSLEGISPDGATLAYEIKACGNLKDIEKAYKLHSGIIKKGFLEQQNVLGGLLITMYIKCGQLSTAQILFDYIPTKDLASWNALIMGCAEQGHGEKALEYLSKMESKGLHPDAVTYVASLRACSCIGAIYVGIELHIEIERLVLSKENAVIGNALVDMYAKCGLLHFAAEVFDRLPIRDVVSWTTFVNGYVEHGSGDIALHLIELMEVEGCLPSIATFVCGLKACAILGDVPRGQEFHSTIEKRGLLERDISLGNSLVDMYAECGMLATAERLFKELPSHDVVSWTALISKYAEYGYCGEALQLFEQMQSEGVSPDAVTFVCSLKACSGLRSVNKKKELYAQIHRQKFFQKSHSASSTLVDMYAKCGFLEKAREVFDELLMHNTVSWNALICGYSEHDQGEEVLKCFEEMQHGGISPDIVTFILCLQACGNLGAVGKGLELHAEIERRCLLGAELVGNTLVDMYAKCGTLRRAQNLVDNLPLRDVVTWTALMRGYAHVGEVENVFLAFERMLNDLVRPDPISFVVILNTCSRSGLFGRSCTYFDTMSNIYGISPLFEHHSCVVDLLSRSGQLEKALGTIKFLSVPVSPIFRRSILSACRNLGNTEFAAQAF
ncbi:hypothetical protein KP509_05G058700 [Ceratopteris richardii]|nr:hypothetical protein KP509_05G058700 [Ceratopteris richardii]